MEQLSDRQLVELCLSGDSKGWSAFLRKFSRLIRWAARQRLARWGYSFNDQDIKDIEQDVLFSLWRRKKLEAVRGRDKIVGWLAMVAGNAACNHFRKKGAVARRFKSIFEVLDNGGTLGETLTSKGNPRQSMESEENKELVDSVLSGLPDRERLIITLNYLYDKKHRDIADTLRISVNTVSTVIRRTRQRIKNELTWKELDDEY